MAQRGRKVRIDLVELEKLCALGCTDEEIAGWFNVSTRTIERRRTNKRFSTIMERGKAKGRVSVRRAQMKMLEGGNATMGVWLGKNLLGQVDQVNYEINAQVTNAIILMPGSDDVDKVLPATDVQFRRIASVDETTTSNGVQNDNACQLLTCTANED
jgi:hypothetical protein